MAADLVIPIAVPPITPETVKAGSLTDAHRNAMIEWIVSTPKDTGSWTNLKKDSSTHYTLAEVQGMSNSTLSALYLKRAKVWLGAGIPSDWDVLTGAASKTATDYGNAASSAANAITSVPKFLQWVTDPKQLVRGGELLIGTVILGVGLAAVFKGTTAGNVAEKAVSLNPISKAGSAVKWAHSSVRPASISQSGPTTSAFQRSGNTRHIPSA